MDNGPRGLIIKPVPSEIVRTVPTIVITPPMDTVKQINRGTTIDETKFQSAAVLTKSDSEMVKPIEDIKVPKIKAVNFKGPSQLIQIKDDIEFVELPVKVFSPKELEDPRKFANRPWFHEVRDKHIVDSELSAYLLGEAQFHERNPMLSLTLYNKGKQWLDRFNCSNITLDERNSMLAASVGLAMRVSPAERAALDQLKGRVTSKHRLRLSRWIHDGRIGSRWWGFLKPWKA